MHRTVLVFPVVQGKTDAEIRSIADWFRARPDEYAESRHRLGVTLERAYQQKTPMGDFVVAYVESELGFGEFVGAAVSSDLAIDRFFVNSVREIHGIDLTQPPAAALPETIGVWTDPEVTTRRRGMAFTAPTLPGVADAGRAFVADAFGRDDMTRSRRALGHNVEVVTITAAPEGEIVGVYLEGDDPWDGNARLAASEDPFDLWFKGELAKLFPPFVDFSQPIAGVTEIFDSVELHVLA